jgi:hypothetical protein
MRPMAKRVFFLIAGWLPLALSALAFALCVRYTLAWGLNVPCSDGWIWVGVHEKYRAGTLGFSDLFVMNGEHLMFVPMALYVAIGAATDLNFIAQTLLTHAQLLVSLVPIWLVASRKFGFKWYRPPWWFVTVPFLLFSLWQRRNLLCSFQPCFVAPLPFTLLALYFLDRVTRTDVSARARYVALGLSLLSGALGSFSHSMGLGAWPAGAFLLLCFGRRRLGYLAAWLAGAAVVCGVYACEYRTSTAHAHHVGTVLSDLFGLFPSLVEFLIHLVGSPIGEGEEDQVISGVVVSLLSAACVYRLWREKRIGENAFWLASLVYGWLVGLMIAVGRIHIGTTQSRYVTYFLVIWIALVCLTTSLLSPEKEQNSPARRLVHQARGVMLALSIVAFGTAYWNGEQRGAGHRTDLTQHVRNTVQGRTGDSQWVERWRALGVDL